MFGAVPISLFTELQSAQGIYYQLELDLGCPPYYFLDPKYFKDEYTGLSYYNSKQQKYGVISHECHPAFKSLRKHLEAAGFIETKPWINGDTVTQPFYFNNHLMEVGDRFLCASACKNVSELTEKYNNGKIL